MGPDDNDREAPTIDERGPFRAAPGRLTIERYRMGEEVLGRGGMGEVVIAHDDQIGREVAIKRLRTETPDDRALARFMREARVQGRLEHPAIPPVYELGRDATGMPFFVMKKLAGTTLQQVVREKDPRYSRENLLRAFVDVCHAVELAHTRGVIHRDLKPSNIMLGDFGEVYVLDWGVAKIMDESDDSSLGEGTSSDDLATGDGAVVGTRNYMAPEQTDGARDLDARVDVYALGCVLFEIVTGMQYKRGPRRNTPIPISMPPELQFAITAATDADRDKRIATARELGERVDRYIDGDRDLAKRRELAGEHLALARAAFAKSDSEEDRRTAIREAGRALALDPTLAGAAELVGRLMLEPPREVPRAVEHALDDGDRALNRKHARTALRMYFGFIGVLPFLIGYHGSPYAIVVFCALIVMNILLVRLRLHGDAATNPWVLALRNAAIVGVLAHLFGPFTIAPMLAVAVMAVMVLTPVYATRGQLVLPWVAMTLAVVLPWIGELVHLLPQTTVFTTTEYIVKVAVPGRDPAVPYTGLLALTSALILMVGVMILTMRQAERATRCRLELLAWQLRQLVQ
jgi:eukaryotic-like serine/threonine-protein kinase